MIFECYRCLTNKNILRLDYADLAQAKAFITTERRPLVVDEKGNEYTTIEQLEELENAESVRSELGNKYDKYFTGFNAVFEDTDRELSGADSDNPESSPECDN